MRIDISKSSAANIFSDSNMILIKIIDRHGIYICFVLSIIGKERWRNSSWGKKIRIAIGTNSFGGKITGNCRARIRVLV